MWIRHRRITSSVKARAMETVSFGIKIALIVFGLGGVVALAIVPWACIGTGLYDKDKKYQ